MTAHFKIISRSSPTKATILAAIFFASATFIGCKSRNYNGTVSSQTSSPENETQNAIYSVLSANYNPYSNKIAAIDEWALARIQTLTLSAELNPPQFVILRNTNNVWKIVKDKLDSVDVRELESAGVPPTTSELLLEKIETRIAATGTATGTAPNAEQEAVYKVLSAKFNPYSNTVAVVNTWSLCQITEIASTTMMPSRQVLLKKDSSSRWAVVDTATTFSVASLLSKGATQSEAQQLIQKLESALKK